MDLFSTTSIATRDLEELFYIIIGYNIMHRIVKNE